MMNIRDFMEENQASRQELAELIGRLDERSFQCAVGRGWTVSTLLCHLAFWDQRVLFLLREWQRGGLEVCRLSSLAVNSINEAVKAISQAVPGPVAGRLALDSAAAVDSQLAEISEALVDQIASAGFERFLKRSLHRREHLQKIEEALAGQPASR
jgi:DinB superfamily